MKISEILNITFGSVLAFANYFWGGADTIMISLLIFVTVDYVTGVLSAIINKTLSSEIGYKGLAKKVMVLIIVGVAHIIGCVVNTPEIRTFVIGYYIANEALSILENSAKMGVPYPNKFINILNQLKGDDNENNQG